MSASNPQMKSTISCPHCGHNQRSRGEINSANLSTLSGMALICNQNGSHRYPFYAAHFQLEGNPIRRSIHVSVSVCVVLVSALVGCVGGVGWEGVRDG